MPARCSCARGGNRGKGDRGRSRGRSQSCKGDKAFYKFRDGKCEEGKRRLYKYVKKLKAVDGPSPCNGKGPMHICNGASVAVVKRALCTFENAVAPRKIQKLANKCVPKKNNSAKTAPRITQKHACIAKGRGCRKPQSMAMKDRCQRAVVVPSKEECIKTIATGEQQKIAHKPRTYEKHYSRNTIRQFQEGTNFRFVIRSLSAASGAMMKRVVRCATTANH